MCDERKLIELRIKLLRAEVWKDRTPEDKASGHWPTGLDYVKMNQIEELQERLEELDRA